MQALGQAVHPFPQAVGSAIFTVPAERIQAFTLSLPGRDEPVGTRRQIEAKLALEGHGADRRRGPTLRGLVDQAHILDEGGAKIAGGVRSDSLEGCSGIFERLLLMGKLVQALPTHAHDVGGRARNARHCLLEWVGGGFNDR